MIVTVHVDVMNVGMDEAEPLLTDSFVTRLVPFNQRQMFVNFSCTFFSSSNGEKN